MRFLLVVQVNGEKLPDSAMRVKPNQNAILVDEANYYHCKYQQQDDDHGQNVRHDLKKRIRK